MEEETKHVEHFIGHKVHVMDNMIGRLLHYYQTSSFSTCGLTPMHCRVISYLYHHSDAQIFQKDIESVFHIARSTATGILQLMEKNGYIQREPWPDDGRQKLLVLTEKGKAVEMETSRNFRHLEQVLTKKISPEDLEVFCNVAEQICCNVQDAFGPIGTAAFPEDDQPPQKL